MATGAVKIELLKGDVRGVLRGPPEESVHCVVTSPPYWGLRDYSACGCSAKRVEQGSTVDGGSPNYRVTEPNPSCPSCKGTGKNIEVSKSQLGLEKTPEEYVQNMVSVFREVRRVLRKDGTCWLNLGDSYTGGKGGGGKGDEHGQQYKGNQSVPSGLKPKDLVGIPWRVAFALQADGWWLRSDIIWSKPNPMPESVTDRPAKAHEYVFLLTKSRRYFYDVDAVRGPLLESSVARISQPTFHQQKGGDKDPRNGGEGSRNRSARQGLENLKEAHERGQGRNLRTVWSIPPPGLPRSPFRHIPREVGGTLHQGGDEWARLLCRVRGTLGASNGSEGGNDRVSMA